MTEPDGPSAGAPAVPVACDDGQTAAIDEVVRAQLSAFRAGDFERALGWATPSFQQGFTPDDFGDMITSSFPVPATARSSEVVACATDGRSAVASVRVVGDVGTQVLQYAMQRLAEGWRIGGAVPVDAGPDASGPII